MPELPNNINPVLGGIVAFVFGLVSMGVFFVYSRRDQRTYTVVGKISRIFVYPIKSCKGLSLSQAEVGALGLKTNGVMDRSFIIINEKGASTTQRHHPSIALIAPSLSDDMQSLLVTAPGMPTLTVPLRGQISGQVYNIRVWRLNVDGEDCGQAASDWLSQYLGIPGFKLVRYTTKLKPKVLKDDSLWGSKAKSHERAVYQDLNQLNLVGEASLNVLNTRLDKPVTIRNFRPNFVVEDSPAYSEDKWKYLRIGDEVLLRATHSCYRCRLTTVDQDAGKFMESGDPLKTLKEYRMASPDDPDKRRYGQSPLFGINLAAESFGTVKLGDVIYASVE